MVRLSADYPTHVDVGALPVDQTEAGWLRRFR